MAHIPPQQPTLEDLTYLAQVLNTDPDSSAFDQILYAYGLSPEAIQAIRQDAALRGRTVQIIQENINKSIIGWENEWFRLGWKTIEDGLTNPIEMDLYVRSLLTTSNRLLQMTAQRLGLGSRPVKNLPDLIERYQQTHYTKQCLARGEHKDNFCFIGSIREHHQEITQQILDKAKTQAVSLDYSSALATAIDADNEPMIELLLTYQGLNLNQAAVSAVNKNNLPLIERLFGLADLHGRYEMANTALVTAARRRNLEIAQWAVDHGAYEFGNALIDALPDYPGQKANNALIDFLIYVPGTEVPQPRPQIMRPHILNKALRRAAGSNNVELTRTFIQLGATEIDDAMSDAVALGSLDTIRLLLDSGASKKNALYHADIMARGDIVDIIRNHGGGAAGSTSTSTGGSIFSSIRRFFS